MTFTSSINWENEIEKIRAMGSVGKSMVDVAKEYGVSRQRIKQIVDKYLPNWGQDYGYAHRRRISDEKYTRKWGERDSSDLYLEQRKKLRSKKANCFRHNVEFSIQYGDLDWPTHCPVFGIELNYFNEFRNEDSPSFDRLDCTKGYVPGNVHIISFRANRIKNNGSADEHRAIADWMNSKS